jgi:hypothetical protein
MRKAVFAFVLAFILPVSDQRARSSLASAGYSDISLQGVSFFGCGDDDSLSREFTATNPQGARVSGVLCCGIFKACTIRF